METKNITLNDDQLLADFIGQRIKNVPDNMCVIEGDLYLKLTRADFDTVYNQRVMKFKTSWDWLMCVVEKCKNTITTESEFIYRFRPALESLKIEQVYTAAVEFVTWYNQNLKTDKDEN